MYLYVSCGRELGARLSASSKCCNSFSLPYVCSGLLPDMKGYFVYPLSLNREGYSGERLFAVIYSVCYVFWCTSEASKV